MSTSTNDNQDIYAGSTETSQGTVFNVSGQDWDEIAAGLKGHEDYVIAKRIVVEIVAHPLRRRTPR